MYIIPIGDRGFHGCGYEDCILLQLMPCA